MREQVKTFKDAGVLLDELRQFADHDEHTHHAHSDRAPLSLADSYRACETITRHHSKSFFLSSQLLPAEKRRAIRVLYAFCRTSDDIVDQPGTDLARALACWVAQVQTPQATHHSVLLAWHEVVARYNIPQHLVNELLAGIAMDLTVNRYATFEELWVYCYRVASVVGLLSMQIIGADDGAADYAVLLGVALQLTNILRDVGEDGQRGRIYLPQEDLARFGLSDEDILAGRHDDRFCALMRFEIERAHQLYEAAKPGIALLSPDSRLAIAAAGEVYRAILGKIEQQSYNVFAQRARVSLMEKLLVVGGLWKDRV
jgi:15-cis-phytoene synthase